VGLGAGHALISQAALCVATVCAGVPLLVQWGELNAVGLHFVWTFALHSQRPLANCSQPTITICIDPVVDGCIAQAAAIAEVLTRVRCAGSATDALLGRLLRLDVRRATLDQVRMMVASGRLSAL
jgi:hypothetical protein